MKFAASHDKIYVIVLWEKIMTDKDQVAAWHEQLIAINKNINTPTYAGWYYKWNQPFARLVWHDELDRGVLSEEINAERHK